MQDKHPTIAQFCTRDAQSIGLEESILWHYLQEALAFADEDYCSIKSHQFKNKFSFWHLQDIQRIAKNLHDRGIIQVLNAPVTESKFLLFKRGSSQETIVNEAPLKQAEAGKPARLQAGANRISPNWQPDRSTLKRLEQDHGINTEFSRQHVSNFVQFWLDKNEVHASWPSKFYDHVVSRWKVQRSEVSYFLKDTGKETAVTANWRPSEDAYNLLIKGGINRNFIDDAIPEFIIYWREKGSVSATWSTKFIQHVRYQWGKYVTALGADKKPSAMKANWQPAKEVYDILKLANIDANFASRCIPEFVLYWQDNGRVQHGWNTRFLQHVKYLWANRNQLQGSNYAQQQRPSGSHAGQPASFIDRHADRSWTEGL